MEIKKFEEAISVISEPLRNALKKISDTTKKETQEIRLRKDRPLTLCGTYGSCFVSKNGRISYLSPEIAIKVTELDISDTLNKMSAYSVYAHQESIAKGYITYGAGFRAGIGGTAVMNNSNSSQVKSVKNINSLNIRIAREHMGAADELMKHFFSDSLKNIIIGGPPASGKTTIIRDLSRQLSSGANGSFYKIVLIDERSEIAGVYSNNKGCNVGVCCDVLTGFPKAEGIIQALRTMSPHYIICDEIGTLEDVFAIEQGINSGVKFAVTIHSGSRDEFFKRPQLKRLIELNAFEFAVLLKDSQSPCEIEEIINMDDYNEKCLSNNNYYDFINTKRSAFVKKLSLESV